MAKKKNSGSRGGVLLALILLLLMGVGHGNKLAAKVERPSSDSVAVQTPTDGSGGESAAGPEAEDSQPRQKARKVAHMKLILMALLMCISTLFLLFLLITMVRISRLRRKQLQIGKKQEKTDASDLWSRYRLKDEDQDV